MPNFYAKSSTPPAPPPALPVEHWRRLVASSTDLFALATGPWADLISSPPAHVSEHLEALGLPTLKGPLGWPGRYWPLEWFRGRDLRPNYPPGVRHFLSSGTTSAVRSRSTFTREGLALYREQSTATFRHVLARVLPPHCANARGLSFVPAVAEWPDSSLAQMLAWIGDELPLAYATGPTLASAVTRHGQVAPVWLFGTAFHLLSAIDSGQALRLPPGSVVIETGGMKGRAREVSRSELYRDISAAFGVSEAAIVSEYGMCELASQAYDFVPFGTCVPLAARRFRFPSWVRIAPLTGPGIAASAGRGALLVADPLHIDLPWPLRTEDLVEVDAHGFALLGRVPASPLKGCSLAAEALPLGPVRGTRSDPPRGSERPLRQPSSLTAAAERRAPDLIHLLAAFAADSQSAALLAAELGSAAAARAALEDLKSGLPATSRAWADAVRTATGGGACPPSWLFILPDNHTLVGLYPAALAYAAGLAVTVRLPPKFADGTNLLRSFLARLGSLPEARLQVCGPELRVPQHDESAAAPDAGAVPTYDAILCYGDDDTVAALRATATVPVQGFGHRIGLSVLSAHALGAGVDALARDVLGLGQRGCMSTRLALITDAAALPDAALAAALAAAGERFWRAPLPWRAAVALDAEALRLERAGFNAYRPATPGHPLVAIKALADGQSINQILIMQALAQAPFTVSVLRCPDDDEATIVKKMNAELGTQAAVYSVTSSGNAFVLGGESVVKSRHQGLSFRALGAANAPPWNGLHEGRALFQFHEVRTRSRG